MSCACLFLCDNVATEGSDCCSVIIEWFVCNQADLEGSRVACQGKLRVGSVGGSKRSHKLLGKYGATPAIMERKWALNVQMAR